MARTCTEGNVLEYFDPDWNKLYSSPNVGQHLVTDSRWNRKHTVPQICITFKKTLKKSQWLRKIFFGGKTLYYKTTYTKTYYTL